jgi:hypothetical protein
MSEDNHSNLPPTPHGLPEDESAGEQPLHPPLPVEGETAVAGEKPRRGRPPSAQTGAKATDGPAKPEPNRVVKLLEKNPLGMTLPEMAGGPRQIKRIKTMRPQLAEAIRAGLVMPVSQRAGHTVYRLVKHIANR